MKLVLAAAAASVLLLSGCSAAADAGSTTTIPADAMPSSPVPSTLSATPTVAAATATCETLIPAQTVSDFQQVGWSFKQEPFMIVATTVPNGLTCKWGDFSSAGDSVQIFGWAPIDAAASAKAQADLLANGWQTIDTDEGVFITEDQETAFATGEQGYGLTYQFGDGWVTYADTKQSLLLIHRPDA